MKRIALSSLLLIICVCTSAQTVTVLSAFQDMQRGYLKKAKIEIDAACKNEDTKDDAQTWCYAGLIYSEIGSSPKHNSLAPDWCSIATIALKRCRELDKKKKYKNECKKIEDAIKNQCGDLALDKAEEKPNNKTQTKENNNKEGSSIVSEVSLMVSADGPSKTDAINNALRSAIEQTFGTFVSANTEILNDELVKDEIATVSSGNIQKYNEVASVLLSNGKTSVTLNVTVSLTKLVKYAQSKGSQCEFAGATFGANLRLYQFNKKNEEIAIQNMIKQLDALRPIYDYELVLGDPHIKQGSNDELTEFNVHINVIPNQKTKQFISIIYNTLRSLAIDEIRAKPMLEAGFQLADFCNDNVMNIDYYRKRGIKANGTYYLYNELTPTIGDFLYSVLFDFAIADNNKKEYTIIEGIHKHNNIDYIQLAGPHIEGAMFFNYPTLRYDYSIGKRFFSYIFLKNDYYYVKPEDYYYSEGRDLPLRQGSPIMDFNYCCIIPSDSISKVSHIDIRPTRDESSVFIIIPNINLPKKKCYDFLNSVARVYTPYESIIPMDVLEVLKKIRKESENTYEAIDLNKYKEKYPILVK